MSKILESEFRKELIKAFELKEDDSLITEIKQLDTQIANLRTKQDEYANLTGDAFETIKNEIKKQN